AGVAVQVGGIARQRVRLGRLLRRTGPAADAGLLAAVADLSARLGLRRPPAVRVLDGAGSPFACGLWRPVLVLPRDLSAALTPAQLRPYCSTSWPTSAGGTCSGAGCRRRRGCCGGSTRWRTRWRPAPGWSASWPVVSWRCA